MYNRPDVHMLLPKNKPLPHRKIYIIQIYPMDHDICHPTDIFL